ncbi:hypothetical protein DEMA109039_16660 [Deinococcus marmoris]
MIGTAGELLEGKARNLGHHVVDAGFKGGGRDAGDVVGQLVQRVAHRQQRGNLGNRIPGGLARQRGATADARVHLDHNDAPVHGVDRELDVAAPRRHADLADDGEGHVAQALVFHVAEGLRRGHGDAVAGMHAHRVKVLDTGDDDHRVGGVAHHLQLVFLPAQDAFFQQHRCDGAVAQAALGDAQEFLVGVRDAATRAAEGEGGANHDGEAQFLLVLGGLFHAVNHLALGRFNADLLHGGLKQFAVLALVDGLHPCADQLHAVLFQRAALVQLHRQVQRGLAAQRGEQGVGLLLDDHLLHKFGCQRLQIRRVGQIGIGHDGRRIAVDQHHPVAFLFQRFERLRSRIVELGSLPDLNGAAAEN